jgi:hypothetical protein
LDGAASDGGVPGIVKALLAVPWPTTAASTWIWSPGRDAVTYWMRHVRLSVSAIFA